MQTCQHAKAVTSSTLSPKPKGEASGRPFDLLAALSVLIAGHPSEVSVSVQPQSVCVSVCFLNKNKQKKSTIFYSLCIMILFLVFITIFRGLGGDV